MPPIYINTDNSNKKKRIYIGDKAGGQSAAVETKIGAEIVKAFVKSADFTTNAVKDPKGYTLFCEVTEFSASGGITIKIVMEIIRYPASFTAKHGSKGEKVMTSGELSGTASATGSGALDQAIEAIMEKIVPKTLPVMLADMKKR